MGVIYEKTNRLSESIKEMEKVLEIDPENAEALNFIGYSYADRGMNLEEAEKMIIKALKIKPDNGYLMDSLGWVNFKKNKLNSAVKYLKQALELLPDDVNIIEHMGDVYVKLNKIKEAQEMYNRALKIDPKNSFDAKEAGRFNQAEIIETIHAYYYFRKIFLLMHNKIFLFLLP